MKDKKSAVSTSIWDHNRGVVRSNIGGWVIGKGVVNRGYEMMEDFVGKLSYMQVVIFNATGRMPERRLADFFEAVHICLSWPDPRIWCNNIGALGGTSRASALASTLAGTLATDARSYGIRPLLEGLAFIQDALRQYKEGMSVEDIVRKEAARHGGKPSMMGYARPIAKGDERVPALERVREEKGFPVGEHLALAFAINDHIAQVYSESINVNGYVSAFWSDQGYTPEEAYRIMAVGVSSGVTACYLDTRGKPAGTFLPMRCEDIDYQGVPPRELP
ncbi:hypothetical protein F6455_16320 [Proteobacteria bacterium 005FR1]|nr:hypothetical protein [Proteobacteria bacterium 005FR1]